MIRFAEAYQDPEKVQMLSAQLSWSHFIEIIYLKDILQCQFFAEIFRVVRWSVRTLRRKPFPHITIPKSLLAVLG